MDLKPILNSQIIPTYAGLPHKLSFYEKLRTKSINQIRNENLKQGQFSKPTILDNTYKQLTGSITTYEFTALDILREIIPLSNYERECISNVYSLKRIINYYTNLLKTNNLKFAYSPKHGYYCYKWSTPKAYIQTARLMQKLIRPNSTLISNISQYTFKLIYAVGFIVSLIIFPLFLLKKRINLFQIHQLARASSREESILGTHSKRKITI